MVSYSSKRRGTDQKRKKVQTGDPKRPVPGMAARYVPKSTSAQTGRHTLTIKSVIFALATGSREFGTVAAPKEQPQDYKSQSCTRSRMSHNPSGA